MVPVTKQGRIVPFGKTLLTQHLMKQRVSVVNAQGW